LTELVLEPLNKTVEEENVRLKTDIEIWKERELSKNNDILLKQELVDEFRARTKSLEQENKRSKGEIQRVKFENIQLKEEVLSLKDKESRLIAENDFLRRREDEVRLENHAELSRWNMENEYLKRREQVLYQEWNAERTRWTVENEYLGRRDAAMYQERVAERTMYQSTISSLKYELENHKRKRNDVD
jgi:hypothetical protein